MDGVGKGGQVNDRVGGGLGEVGVLQLQVALTHLFCELEQVWKTQVVDDISGAHQHRAAVLLQQLEVVGVRAVPVELVEDRQGGRVALPTTTHTTMATRLKLTASVSTQSLHFQGIEIVSPVGRLLLPQPLLASAHPHCHCQQDQHLPSAVPHHFHNSVTCPLHNLI